MKRSVLYALFVFMAAWFTQWPAAAGPDKKLQAYREVNLLDFLPKGSAVLDFAISADARRAFLVAIPPPAPTGEATHELVAVDLESRSVLGRHALRYAGDTESLHRSEFVELAGPGPDADEVIVGSGYDLMRLNVMTGETVSLWTPENTGPFTRALQRAALAPGGEHFVALYREYPRVGIRRFSGRAPQVGVTVASVRDARPFRECLLGEMSGVLNPGGAISLSADGRSLFYETYEGGLLRNFVVMDLETCRQIQAWQFPEVAGQAVFLFGGTTLAVTFGFIHEVHGDSRLRLLDVATGRVLLDVKAPRGFVSDTSIGLAPDQKHIAFSISVASQWFWQVPMETYHYPSCGVDVWNAQTRKRMATIRPHRRSKGSCEFESGASPRFTGDGKTLVLLTVGKLLFFHLPSDP